MCSCRALRRVQLLSQVVKHGEGQLAAAAHHVTGALRLHLLSHMQKRLRCGCVMTSSFAVRSSP